MIVFEVKINGQHVSTAGVGEFGFLFTDVMWSKRNPGLRPKGTSKKLWEEQEFSVRTTGQTLLDASTRELLRWKPKPLSVGDKIVIRVLERSTCDTPIERERSDQRKSGRRRSATKSRPRRAVRRKSARR